MTTGKILVVGGGGYVGCVLTRELLEQGYAVRVFDRLYFGDYGVRKFREQIELVIGDIRTMERSVLEGVDSVIHLAGLSNDPMAEYNPKANEEINTLATKSLADLCAASGVRRFLFASSCSIYDRGISDGVHDQLLTEEAEVEPRAAYSVSKYVAERLLLKMVSDEFCPIILRMGTVFGFSPRMRYDLVLNTFVRDALSSGSLTVHRGGEMWRPLVEVSDAAGAYLTCLNAPEEKVKGEIFNVAFCNARVSELALRTREVLRSMGIPAEVCAEYGYRGIRSYRVSTAKIENRLGFRPKVTIEESVQSMVRQIREYGYEDFFNPRYDNIQWMRLLEEAAKVIAVTGSVFEVDMERQNQEPLR